MEFQYTAKGSDGKNSSGLLTATSMDDARAQLRSRGSFPISLKPVTKTGSSESSSAVTTAPRAPWGRGNVRKTDLLMLTTQLSIMVRSGADLAEALQSSARQATNPKLKSVLNNIYGHVAEGMAVSVAMRQHSEVFGHAYIASIAAAEASGQVEDVLKKLAELLRNEVRLQGALRSILAYPAVLVLVACVVVVALIFFVLPQFAGVFESLGTTPPPFTEFLLESSRLIRGNLLYVFLGGAATAFGLYHLLRSEKTKDVKDRLLLNARVFSTTTRSLLTGRSFRMLGAMLESGIPLLDALVLCRSSIGNRLFRQLFHEMEVDVVNGRGIAGVLSASPYVPSAAAQMVATAERSGKLGEVMHNVGEFYEEEGEQQLRQLVKLLEPCIIIVMGALVGGVVLAVMLPLLDVSTVS